MIVRLVTGPDRRYVGTVTLPPLVSPDLISWSDRHFLRYGCDENGIPIYRECPELYTTNLDPEPGDEE